MQTFDLTKTDKEKQEFNEKYRKCFLIHQFLFFDLEMKGNAAKWDCTFPQLAYVMRLDSVQFFKYLFMGGSLFNSN